MVASFPAEQVTSLVRAQTGEVFLATSNPGKVHVLEPGGGAQRHVHLEGQGHRHRLELGTRALGRRAARGDRDPGPDAQREHGHARQHLVSLVGALHEPPGRAGRQRARALPPGARDPGRPAGPLARARHAGGRVPAAQPAGPRSRRSPSIRRARSSRSRSRCRARWTSWASTSRAIRRAVRAAAPRAQHAVRHRLQPPAVPEGRADLLLAGGRPQRRHARLRRLLPAARATAASGCSRRA